jgi:hypothetical protein
MDRVAYLTREVVMPQSLSQPVPSQPADQATRPQKLTVLIYEIPSIIRFTAPVHYDFNSDLRSFHAS